MNAIETQFIEVAARTIYDATREPGCQSCGWGGRSDKTLKTHEAWGAGFGIIEHRYDPRSEDPDTASKILAGKLWGMVIQANGATLEQIVTAANRAACTFTDTTGRCRYPGQVDGSCGSDRGHIIVDPVAFFRAITLEALGTGKVREAFGEITLNPTPSVYGGVPFIVPGLAIDKELLKRVENGS